MQIIKGGQVIDPGNINALLDIYIKNGKIVALEPPEKFSTMVSKEDNVHDAQGKIVVPGLIDIHVHLREPGFEHKETIESGCRAAASGGFTAVCCMPNTHPVNDTITVTSFIKEKAQAACGVKVYPVAAISQGLEGKMLSDYAALKKLGVVALSDDGLPVNNSQMMRRALEEAHLHGLLIISHSEDFALASNGQMNEGVISNRMGVKGIPNAAESIMVMRDIALSELTNASIHIAHVSTKESVRVISEAKKRGLPVTAETAPHYFTLTDKAVEMYGTSAKMNPPLRSETDRIAIREGLTDGTIDVIATDHAPHASSEKAVNFSDAPNGIIGLETSLGLSLKLVSDGVLTLESLIEKMSKNPARLIGLDNDLKVGNAADISIIDMDVTYTVASDQLKSLSTNSPFIGWELKGRADMTMVNGKCIYCKHVY